MSCRPRLFALVGVQPGVLTLQALESKVLLDTAMSLYNLEHSELYWEKAQDTKLLIAWNHDTIVIAFRGTSSMANALADLQVDCPAEFSSMLRGSRAYPICQLMSKIVLITLRSTTFLPCNALCIWP